MRVGSGAEDRGSPGSLTFHVSPPRLGQSLRDWRSVRVGVALAAGAACFPYLQALVGRVCPSAREQRP